MERNKLVTISVLMIIVGSFFFVVNLLDVNASAYVFPLLLIGIGVWLVTQPKFFTEATQMQFLGKVDRTNTWTVSDEKFWVFIGDVKLDFTSATVLPGESKVEIHGFIGDVHLRIPENVGVRVTSMALVTSAHAFGHKQDYALTPYEMESPGYATAEQKVLVDLSYFIVDLKIEQGA